MYSSPRKLFLAVIIGSTNIKHEHSKQSKATLTNSQENKYCIIPQEREGGLGTTEDYNGGGG